MTGITDIPDSAIFAALKKFQKDFGLAVTGIMNPDDAILRLLNLEIAKTPKGQYIWRTVNDGKVRKNHAVLSNTIRAWSDSPDPGEDFGCRCWAEHLSDKKVPIINNELDRRNSIINNTLSIFEIDNDPMSKSESPWYENSLLATATLKNYSETIEKITKEQNFDSDLVKSIMWAENARGGYWGAGYLFDKVKITDSIMPMNINPILWSKILTEDKKNLYKPENNIEAATILLKRIKARIINPTPEKIAAIWQFGGAEKTNDYSAYVGRIYKEKPWLKTNQK
jgi:hypothetical protein